MERIEEKDFLENNYKIYLSEIKNIPQLSKEEETKFLSVMKTDEYARNRIIESYLMFVVLIAKKYWKKDLSLMDLIQEGNLGLQHATHKYDAAKKASFSSYAYFYIRKYILTYIYEKTRQIRIPASLLKDIYRYKKTLILLEAKLNRLPTINEIATEMKVSSNRIHEIFFYLNDSRSFSEIINEDSRTELGNLVKNNSYSVEEIFFENEFKTQIKYLIENSKLTDKEKNLIFKHYGFYSNHPMNFNKFALEVGTTHQAVHSLHKNALKKLRKSSKKSCLNGYI